MSTDRLGDEGRLAWLPSGRVTTWAVAVFWVVVAAFAYGPASSLSEVQENDTSAWLPRDAESTQVLERMAAFQSANEIPAIVVYTRDGGVTAEDLASVQEQVAGFDQLKSVRRESAGPFPSLDGEALQVVVPVDPGAEGWEATTGIVEELQGVVEASTTGHLGRHHPGAGGCEPRGGAARRDRAPPVRAVLRRA